MRMEHGFIYSRRQRSPSIEPDYEDDDAWWDRLAEEAKESLRDVQTETIRVVESTSSVPASTTMSTSTAMVVEETPSAMHGTNRTNPPPTASVRDKLLASAHVQREHKVLMDKAREEIDYLRK